MIAALPMYARPENRAAHDALWALIRDNLRAAGLAAPDSLDHQIGHMESWAHPDLALGQICNLPYRARFQDHVTLIGNADYEIEGCAPGTYNSVIIARADDPRDTPQAFSGAAFAYSEALSNSGYGAAYLWAQVHGISLHPTLHTGSHAASIAAVRSGNADFAAIDAHTWWIECTRDAALTLALKVIDRTATSPGMAFITRTGEDPAAYFAAISAAISALPESARTTLRLRGIVRLPSAAYDIPLPPDPAKLPV